MKKVILALVFLSLFFVGCTQEEIIYFEDGDIFDTVYEVTFDDFEMYDRKERPLAGHIQEKYKYDEGPITLERAEEVFINYLDGLGWRVKDKNEESDMFNKFTFENNDYENDLLMYSQIKGFEEALVFLEFPYQ